jgi:hypothetical protein
VLNDAVGVGFHSLGHCDELGGMVAIQFFLGFIEAAFLLGAQLIMSIWYTCRELATGNGLWFCGNLILKAFSASAFGLARAGPAGGIVNACSTPGFRGHEVGSKFQQ